MLWFYSLCNDQIFDRNLLHLKNTQGQWSSFFSVKFKFDYNIDFGNIISNFEIINDLKSLYNTFFYFNWDHIFKTNQFLNLNYVIKHKTQIDQ